MAFVKKLIQIRKDHPCFNRKHWFQGSPIIGDEAEGIAWFSTDGTRMNKSQWKTESAKTLGIFLSEQPNKNKREVSERFFILLNAHDKSVVFTLPSASFNSAWSSVFDTADLLKPDQVLQAGEKISVEGRSFILLQG